jgi:hypothetical protein
VRKGGGLGGYRWGIERKRSLLKAEASPSTYEGEEKPERSYS